MKALRDALHAMLKEAVPGLVLNSHPEHRLPNTLHVSFPGVSGCDLLAAAAEDFAASVGSMPVIPKEIQSAVSLPPCRSIPPALPGMFVSRSAR